MGHGIKGFRFGSAMARKVLPILNSAYPADASVTFNYNGSTSATFEAVIETDGKPAEYTYQWYVDGAAVSGATSATYTRTVSDEITHTVYCCVTSKAGSVYSRTATLTANCNDYTLSSSTIKPSMSGTGNNNRYTGYADMSFFEKLQITVSYCYWVRLQFYIEESNGTSHYVGNIDNNEYSNKTVTFDISGIDCYGRVRIYATGDSTTNYAEISRVVLIS